MDEIVLGVIPARWASSRFPGKPLAEIAGKPMIQWVWERAAESETLDRLLVATDDERIYRAVESFGGEAMMTPGDIRSGSDRVAWVAQRLPQYGIIANIQGDEPLLEAWVLDTAVRTIKDDASAEVATLARVVTDPGELDNVNTARVVLDNNGYALYFSRAVIPHCRDIPDRSKWIQAHPFYDQIGLYVYRRRALLQFASLPPSSLEGVEKLEQLRLLQNGVRIKVAVVDFRPVCVDTPADLEAVKAIVEHKRQGVVEDHGMQERIGSS